MSLYKVSIGRAAFEDVVVGIVPGKFRGMCFEVFRSAAQERAGLAAQAALQFAQRLGVGRLVGARFGGYGAALSGADVEPRLYGDAGEERYRGCEVFGREAGMEACEQFFVECPSDDGHDVALFVKADATACAGVISVFMIVVVEMSVRVPPEAANGKFRKARRTGLILCFVCCIS